MATRLDKVGYQFHRVVQSKPHFEVGIDIQPLTAAEKRAILELKGSYSECRGNDVRRRNIHLPLNQRGMRLVTQLIRSHTANGRACVIIRGLRRVPAYQNDIVIPDASSGENAFDRAMNKVRGMFEAGKIPKPPTAEQRRVQRIADVRKWLENARETVAKYEAELATLEA